LTTGSFYTAINPLPSGNIPGFTNPMSEMASMLFRATGRRRGSHSACMIAATATISDAPPSPLNLKDFDRFIPFGLHPIPSDIAAAHPLLSPII
jgi:predicted nucleic acid-binding protein